MPLEGACNNIKQKKKRQTLDRVRPTQLRSYSQLFDSLYRVGFRRLPPSYAQTRRDFRSGPTRAGCLIRSNTNI